MLRVTVILCAVLFDLQLIGYIHGSKAVYPDALRNGPKDDTYEYKFTNGEVLVLTYCETKSTLKTTSPHFHKDKCISRHLELYAKNCMEVKDAVLDEKRRAKSCSTYKRRLQSSSKGKSTNPSLRETRLLLAEGMYHICRSKNAGIKTFNRKKYICCSGEVYKSQRGHLQCCGKSIVNVTVEMCCQGNTYLRKSEDDACCGSTMYNKSTSFCNDGNIYPFEGNDTGIESNVTKTFVQKYEPHLQSTQYEAKDEVRTDKHTVNGNPKNVATIVGGVVSVFLIGAGIAYWKKKQCKSGQNKKDRNETTIDHMPDNPKVVYTVSDSNSSYTHDSAIFTSDNRSDDISTTIKPEDNVSVDHSDKANNHSGKTNNHSDKTNNHSDKSNPTNKTKAEVHNNVTDTRDTRRSRRQSGESLYSAVTLNMSDFLRDILKDTDIKDENLVANLVKEASTQTCVEKETNRRDMFGNPFQLSCILTKENPTVKLANSDAQMTISDKDLSQHNIEVHVSSHTSLPEICEKMNVADDHHVISPCMEYDLPGIDKFGQHAVIKLKLAGGLTGQVHVWRRAPSLLNEDGSQTNHTVEVPIVERYQADLDTFCIIRNGEAFIYTKVFSTYVCTRDSLQKEIDLEGVLYAKMSSTPTLRVQLTMYVVETLHIQIQDYKSTLDKGEQVYGMRRIQHNSILLPDTVTDKDTLIVKLSIDQTEEWDFRRDPNNPDVEFGTIMLSLCTICCQRKPIGHSRHLWHIDNKPGTKPDTFGCHLYIRTENQQPSRPVFTVAEAVYQFHINCIAKTGLENIHLCCSPTKLDFHVLHLRKMSSWISTCTSHRLIGDGNLRFFGNKTCPCQCPVRAELSKSPSCSIDRTNAPRQPHKELGSPENSTYYQPNAVSGHPPNSTNMNY